MSSSYRIAWTGVAAGMALLTAFAAATPARAADPAMAELLKILRERGSLTQAEYEALSASTGASTGDSAESSEEKTSDAKAPPAAVVPAPVSAGPASDVADAAAAPASGAATENPKTLEEVAAEVEDHGERIDKAEAELEEQKKSIFRIKEVTDGTSSDLINKTLAGKWYERISIRGYTQFRATEVLHQNGPQLEVPVDRSVRDDEYFVIRRGRLVFSGDVTDRLFLYAQTDLNAFIGSNEAVVQLRDLYGDIALDTKKEWRLRFGLTKLPYGFANMQSSQNRAALERPDAINSTMEGERDYGAYLMWAPADIRLLFKDIVKRGLKGSGDYGVVAIGAYNGQGMDRPDQNSEPHVVGRVAYPFQLENGQIFELGAQYHWGRYVTNLSDVNPDPLVTQVPNQPSNGAIDQRGGMTFIWYPQPFGIEAEWNVGQGPELNPNGNRVESRFLHGGYVQLEYKYDMPYGTVFPFTRWNYYKGGRKFGNNAPHESVNELDTGFEYSPFPEIELTLQYTHTFDRTNARIAPYDLTKNADRLGIQVQWNY